MSYFQLKTPTKTVQCCSILSASKIIDTISRNLTLYMLMVTFIAPTGSACQHEINVVMGLGGGEFFLFEQANS